MSRFILDLPSYEELQSMNETNAVFRATKLLAFIENEQTMSQRQINLHNNSIVYIILQ